MKLDRFIAGGVRLASVGAVAAVMSIGPVSAETVLKAVMHAPLRILDPILTTANITVAHSFMNYDLLFGLDDKLQPKPQMVDTYTISDDELEYTFTLREGLKFSNGQPITTEDVIASLDRWRKRDAMGQILTKKMKGMEVVDERTFKITLNEPFGWLLYSLGKTGSNHPIIVPKSVAQTPHTEAITDYTASGPFMLKVDEFRPGVKAVYVKNPHYKPRSDEPVWNTGGKVAKVDRVEWLAFPDAMTAVNALTNGEIDFMESVPADLAPLLEDVPGVNLKINNPLPWQGTLRMNTLNPPFDNPKIRRAVLMAINQEDYMRAQVGNPELYKVCPTFYICGTTFATEEGSEGLLKGDTEGAKKLLEEAGYKGEKVVILQPTDYPEASAYGPITNQALREAGFNVDMQVMDWSAVQTRRTRMEPVEEGGWSIFHSNWSAFTVLNPFSSQPMIATGKSAWLGWPEDAKIEELRAAFTRESDLAKQKEIAAEVQKRAYEIGLYGNLGEYFPRIAYRDNVKGIVEGSGTFFWNISLEKKK